METVWENYKGPIIAVFVVIAAALSTLFVVSETEQAVVIRAGEPNRTINKFNPNESYGETGAGIQWRIPFYERVQRISRQILDFDMQRQQVLSSDQQRIEVDAYARYRIIDPVRMVQTAGTSENVSSQLSPILTSVLRQELGRRTFASLLTAERGTAMTNIRDALDRQARQYGAQVLDVRIKRADLPEGTPLTAAFTRMQSDRQEEAETIRAGGRRDAQITRAEAEAQAARIYADAYNQDPDFYDFYRAMESYRRTFEQGTGESSIVMDENNEYLRQFRGPGG